MPCSYSTLWHLASVVQPFEASITVENLAPSLQAKMSKMLIRVSPLVFGLCGTPCIALASLVFKCMVPVFFGK
jgi:hypothetical protein